MVWKEDGRRKEKVGYTSNVFPAQSLDVLTATYYDHKYRPIQTVSTNTRGHGVDRTTSVYDFVGKVLNTKATTEGYDIARRFEYDHAGRLLETWHRLNSVDSVLLAKNEYNEPGQLVVKKLHSEDGAVFKQEVDHAYNIRGWLNTINDPDVPFQIDRVTPSN